MGKVAYLILRTRPFLWLLGLTMLGLVAALFWEGPISYDDGGLGTASFLVVVTLGLPFLLPGQILGFLEPSWLHVLTWPLGLVSGFAFYLVLDRLSLRYVKRQAAKI